MFCRALQQVTARQGVKGVHMLADDDPDFVLSVPPPAKSRDVVAATMF